MAGLILDLALKSVIVKDGGTWLSKSGRYAGRCFMLGGIRFVDCVRRVVIGRRRRREPGYWTFNLASRRGEGTEAVDWKPGLFLWSLSNASKWFVVVYRT
jgi:hypothetical protein